MLAVDAHIDLDLNPGSPGCKPQSYPALIMCLKHTPLIMTFLGDFTVKRHLAVIDLRGSLMFTGLH